MRPMVFVILIVSTSLFFLSCDQQFDVRQPFEEQLVVFSILSTDRPRLIVRVERTYMPADFNPLAHVSDNFVENAVVTVDDGTAKFRLRDTTLARSDTSRFRFPLRAYILDQLTVQYGKRYSITVQSSVSGTAGGSAVVPGKPSLALGAGGSDVLDNPGRYQDDDAILFQGLLSNITKGFIARLFVDYRVFADGSWIDGRIEVPREYIYSDFKDYKYVTYAKLTRCESNRVLSAAYTNVMYNAALIEASFVKHVQSSSIIFQRVVLQLLQVEQNLYNYYKVAHVYDDLHSTRLDEPLYSVIDGGVGVVGAYTLDSLVHTLPPNFPYNRN